MDSLSKGLDDYRSRFSARAPDLTRKQSDDELDLVSEELLGLSAAPAKGLMVDALGLRGDAEKYLWVIRRTDLVCALEHGGFGKSRNRGTLSHTNLTGGVDAHSGGEAWFCSEKHLIFNGGSSRYRPRGVDELEAIATALRRGGYECCHMGWDSDNNIPSRVFRGALPWQ